MKISDIIEHWSFTSHLHVSLRVCMCVVCVQAYSQTYLLDSNSRRGWEELSSFARTKKDHQERLRLGDRKDRSSLKKHREVWHPAGPWIQAEALKSDLPGEGLSHSHLLPIFILHTLDFPLPLSPALGDGIFRSCLETQDSFHFKMSPHSTTPHPSLQNGVPSFLQSLRLQSLNSRDFNPEVLTPCAKTKCSLPIILTRIIQKSSRWRNLSEENHIE